ncbi:uncharacterized protein LOC117593300 [Esox lucius]|uniref:uncharacterized protein LOC117593300 n=1 Tax=Esox lucius TaxID=8010 RepID=UPI0014769C04|nr:uncharacterized protein LOC117593300 [Esox lucius]XP_034143781.1 uncharacterized protein LOC117593300 [Esox lucius]
MGSSDTVTAWPAVSIALRWSRSFPCSCGSPGSPWRRENAGVVRGCACSVGKRGISRRGVPWPRRGAGNGSVPLPGVPLDGEFWYHSGCGGVAKKSDEVCSAGHAAWRRQYGIRRSRQTGTGVTLQSTAQQTRSVVPSPLGRSGPAGAHPVEVAGGLVYRVDLILDSQLRRGQVQYLVDWAGYSPEEHSWVWAVDICGPSLTSEFHACRPDWLAPCLRGHPGRRWVAASAASPGARTVKSAPRGTTAPLPLRHCTSPVY